MCWKREEGGGAGPKTTGLCKTATSMVTGVPCVTRLGRVQIMENNRLTVGRQGAGVARRPAVGWRRGRADSSTGRHLCFLASVGMGGAEGSAPASECLNPLPSLPATRRKPKQRPVSGPRLFLCIPLICATEDFDRERGTDLSVGLQLAPSRGSDGRAGRRGTVQGGEERGREKIVGLWKRARSGTEGQG